MRVGEAEERVEAGLGLRRESEFCWLGSNSGESK
jgi:hypothetical protein